MPKIDPKQFKLLKRSPAGKISAQEIATEAIQVEGSFAYTVVDAGSGKLPTRLQARRTGQDLQVYVNDEPVIRLEGFYAPVNGNTAFDGSGELFAPAADNYDSGYALVTGDPLGASDKVIVGKPDAAPEGDGWSWTTWGGLIGLGALGAAAAGGAGSSSGGGGTGGNNGGGTGGNNGGGTGGNNGGGTGGNTGGGGGTTLPPLTLISSRAGLVADDGLANASVQIRLDANADGRIDTTEAVSALAATLRTSGSASATRGQFSLPDAISANSFNPNTGVLQFTSTGGTASALGNEVAVSGPVQYLAYLTHPVSASDAKFQVVLSPMTTLASNLFRNQLLLGKPAGFDAARAYTEDLDAVADALGVAMPADALMSIAPERSTAQRVVAERQVNALLNALVSLASGKSDASAPVTSATASADVGYRLAAYLVNHGSLAMTDASELQAALASVLPGSVAIDAALAGALEKLMRAFALANDGDTAMAQAAMKVLPQLSGTLAALKTAMTNGTLDDASVQADLSASLQRFASDLDSALKSATPSAYARVIVNAQGAFIDQNLDGQLNDDDRLNGDWVAADFSAAKNADPAANRVVITYQHVPAAGSTQLPATLTANDRVSVHLGSANFGNQLDLQWSALESSADARLLKTLQSSGLKPDLSLTARGTGSNARLAMGKLGNATEAVTTNLGAVAILAAGNQNGFMQSTAELLLELKGTISGPARVQAAGMHSSASLTVDAPAGLETAELMAVATGHSANATINMHQSAADKTLKVGSLSATSHAADGQSQITLNGDDGKVLLGSQLSALAAGSGSSAIIEVNSGKGAIGPATTGMYSAISAIATGGNASMAISSLSGAIDIGSVRVEAAGSGSTSTVAITSVQAPVTLYGAASVIASASQAHATLSLSGNASVASATAVRTAALNIAASGDGAIASISLDSTKGIIQVGGAMALSSSGANSTSLLNVSTGAGNQQFDGAWSVESTGYQARSSVVLTQQAGHVSNVNFAQDISMAASGYGSGVSLVLDQQAGAAGNINVAGIALENRAGLATDTAESQLTLLTNSGNFSASGALDFLAAGEHSGIAYHLGSAAALDANAPGDVSLHDQLTQQAAGVNSHVSGTITAAGKFSADYQILSYAIGAGSSSTLNFDGKAGLTLGRQAAPTSSGLILSSSGYGATAAITANRVQGAVSIYGNVTLDQSSAYQSFLANSNTTQLGIFGGRVSALTIGGNIGLAAGSDAVNATAQVILSANAGSFSVSRLPGSPVQGDVNVSSSGYNSVAKFIATATPADASASVAGFNVDGSFHVLSNRAGDLQTPAYGAQATVTVGGQNATLHIGGDLGVDALGEFSRVDATFVFTGTPGASQLQSAIDGDVHVSADGIGSTASLRFSIGAPVVIRGGLAVDAKGIDAFTRFSGGNIGSIGGDVIVAAGDPTLVSGAYASAFIGPLSSLGTGKWLVTASGQSDVAVLDVLMNNFGGAIDVGRQTSDAGKAYLGFLNATAGLVTINSIGTATITMAMADDDRSNEVLKTTTMALQGFRVGTDHLFFSAPNLYLQIANLDLRGGTTSADQQITTLLETARAEFGAEAEGFATFYSADIGADKYLAYDLNGSGLTGLVRLDGLAGINANLLLAAQGSPGFTKQLPSENTVIADGSINRNFGDIDTGDIQFAVTAGALTKVLTFNADVGAVAAGIIDIAAQNYRSIAWLELGAHRNFSGPTLMTVGDITLLSAALESQTRVDLQAVSSSFAADVTISGGLRMVAQGDNSQSLLIAKTNSGAFTVTDLVDVQANGYRAITKLSVQDYDGLGTTVYAKFLSDVSVRASGYLADSAIEVDTSGVEISGDVSSVAAGVRSFSSVDLLSLWVGAKIGGDISALASGELAQASVHISASAEPVGLRNYVINGRFAATATGNQSRADATIDLPADGIKASVSIGSLLAAEAGGYKSSALVRIAAVNGDLTLQGAGVSAAGAQSSATLTLTTGLATRNPDGTGSPAANGDGNILVNGVISVHADAIPIQDSPTSNAVATVLACAGNVSTGGLQVSAINGRASLLVQAGSVNTQGDLVAGSVSINGAAVFEATGSYATVAARLFSYQEVMTLGGNLTVLASGSNSASTLNAESHWVDNAEPTSPQTLMSLNGNLLVLASGNAALASAAFRETGRDLRFNGDVNVSASGDHAQAESTMYGAGTSAFVSTVHVNGSLVVSAWGAASNASLDLAGENFESDPDLIVSGAGAVTVNGPIFVFSAGAHAVAELSISNNDANDLPAGVLLNSTVTVRAAGMGSASNLTVSAGGTAVTGVSRPLVIAGMLDVQVTGAEAHATATLDAAGEALSVGGMTLRTAGADSELTLMAKAKGKLELLNSGLEAVTSGDDAITHITLAAGSAGLTINGDLNLVGSGDNSLLEASLASAAGSLLLTKDVQLHSLGDGSEVRLSLSQASSAAVSVAGVMNLTADSGAGSMIGASASSDITLGKLGASSIDLFLNAIQDHDSASVSLKLFTDGGVAQLGGADQHGTANLTLGEKTAAANQLLDEIDISFSGSSGKAIINFGVDQDGTSSSAIQQVLVTGFRLGVDELNFSGLSKVATTGVTLDSFIGGAIGHFNTATGATTTPQPVADVFIGGNANATYIAYDYDGTGISAIVVLEGVSASDYKTANGLA